MLLPNSVKTSCAHLRNSVLERVREYTSIVITTVFVIIPLAVVTINFLATPPKVYAAHSRVNLLTANGFAVLGGSGISDTGVSTITGNVGLDPTGGASITGLTCAEITGTIYDNNGGYTGGGGGSTACLETNAGLLTQAKNDLITAYNDAAGRPTTSTIATDLAGATLTDGTYDSASGTFEINGSGTLTLDGGGSADAVFIFKMATTLVTSSSSRIVLTNGAQPCNVFWQVGSSATLGTSTTFVGNVLALTSITDDGSSTVNGRLLARNGAVTLNNTTITTSNCASTSSSTSSSSNSGSSSTNAPAARVCPVISYVTPIILESRRVDADSVFISWGPYGGTDSFLIEYGTEKDKWLYNTTVTAFSTTINNLPLNQPIWIRIAATDNCSVGAFGDAKLVGGPGLPNTGIAPREKPIH